ncbi:hypothetical protein [Photorhabdus heterorhabditis]|uniref:hypothetical protein n=1 Tax=Photorhabdus heterorhabditis TaxID=880156 RepID=UPI001561EB13|nr:hypothetical protein [Photorhabdus heterorhabditis]NRN27160.1 hypothetical protein [Photorhabdus heterorhabditis subsp. aluminescens]
MELNKIIIVAILTFGIVPVVNKADQDHYIVTFNDAIITVPYSNAPNTFDYTVSSGVMLKGERASAPEHVEIRWKNCSLKPVVQRLLSRVILKVWLALPWDINKPDKPPKSC